MADIIFCDTAFHQNGGYVSYDDFYRLVELSSYPIIPLSQLDPNDASKCYIVTPLNDEWGHGWPGARARIIHYELEWRTDWRADVNTPSGIAETWTMDAAYAARIGAKYVPIGSHPGLMLPMTVGDAQPYDGCFLAYMVPRRQQIAHELQQLGLSLAPHSPGNGFNRHQVLRQSRAMLHIHQHEHIRGVACLRWAIAAAYRLPIISESVDDYGIFNHSNMLTGDFGSYARNAYAWLKESDPRVLAHFGQALHQLLCVDKTFKHMIEANV